jgi:hypothetical protein
LNLFSSDGVAAGVDDAFGFYPVKLVIAEMTILSIATPVFFSGHNGLDEHVTLQRRDKL